MTVLSKHNLPSILNTRGLLGSLPQLNKDRLGLFGQCFRECGDIGRIRLGPIYLYLVFHPSLIKEILQKQADNFLRETRGYENIRIILGRGLVTSEGEIWRRQRQYANKFFSPQRFSQMIPAMDKIVAQRLNDWNSWIDHKGTIDIYEEMAKLNLALFDVCYLDGLLGPKLSDLYYSQVFFSNYLFKRATRIFTPPLWFPLNETKVYQEHLKNVRLIMKKLIDDYKNSPQNKDSVLSLILNPIPELDEKEVDFKTATERLCTFIATGHQTLTTMLTWTWYLLSRHPDIAEMVREEIEQVTGEGDVVVEHLPQLIYTEQIIKESLRLYPPVWHLPKRSVKDCEIGEYFIPARSIIMVSQYLTHRHPDFWERPEEFIPERFSPEKAGKIDPYAYFPFGAGPHHCIGQGLAMTQAKIIIAHVIRKYRFKLQNDEVIDVDPRFELLPKKPVIMRVERVEK